MCFRWALKDTTWYVKLLCFCGLLCGLLSIGDFSWILCGETIRVQQTIEANAHGKWQSWWYWSYLLVSNYYKNGLCFSQSAASILLWTPECAMIDVLFNYADGKYQPERNLNVYLSAHLETKLNFACIFFLVRINKCKKCALKMSTPKCTKMHQSAQKNAKCKIFFQKKLHLVFQFWSAPKCTLLR